MLLGRKIVSNMLLGTNIVKYTIVQKLWDWVLNRTVLELQNMGAAPS